MHAKTLAQKTKALPEPEIGACSACRLRLMSAHIERSQQWFEKNQWTVFDFQLQAWQAWHRGESGLIHSPTGSGKTLAAWLGPVQGAIEDIANSDYPPQQAQHGLRVLWITPLRALAKDTVKSLMAAANAHHLSIRVEARTGDTDSRKREQQRYDPPFAMVTTPESLSVLLSYKDGQKMLSGVHSVVVDEWHELLASKRGVQLELCLARLRSLNPALRTWGLSATLANLDAAMTTLLGPDRNGVLIQGLVPRDIEVKTLLPKTIANFPWSGHLGIQLIEPVVESISEHNTTLLFTNTRAQSELWFKALLEARPDWLETLSLHHGSIDRALRHDIEDRLSEGKLRCVVCTSSLDLGVDFSPVDQVIQVGSPKGVARLMQRAGRSGHRPGARSQVLCVPTNTLELVEIAAVRLALKRKRIEARNPLTLTLDVLSQHLITLALGAGFKADEILQEVRNTHAFSEITEQQWTWVMDFITRGGQALQGYPQYHKVLNVQGVHRVMNNEIGQRHRMSIGTISSDTQVSIAYRNGRRLGTTEENFIARLNQGDVFQFAGKSLELLQIKDLTAYVKNASRRGRFVARWGGTQMPLSTELASSVLDTLDAWRDNTIDTPELTAIDHVLSIQTNWSCLPGADDFLIEAIDTGDTNSLFCYPFAGRLANEGLAMVVSTRLTRLVSITLELQMNDYGFELQSSEQLPGDEETLRELFKTDNLLSDILEAINTGEIAKRKFRDIAKISGLIFDGYPGRAKSARQIQASSGLIFEVLQEHDSSNLLLEQSRQEVLAAQLEFNRLETALQSVANRRWIIKRPERLTPLSFPLWAEGIQSQTMSSESYQVRVERMLKELETAARPLIV